ncbi:MAG: integrase, partial [Elusimicrobia bacterium]|nr:integrase [Elusimicrobiota bacterium]
GRPMFWYVDKDSIYKINRQASIEEQLREEQPLTQFARAMKELGVEVRPTYGTLLKDSKIVV